MKNTFIKKNANLKKNKNKTIASYIVIFLVCFCMLGSILGTIGFVRTFAEEDIPFITNQSAVPLESGVDLSDKWIAIEKPISSDDENIIVSLNIYDFIFNFDVNAGYYDFDGVVFNEPIPDIVEKNGYYLFHLDFEYYKGIVDYWIENGEDLQPLTNMVVSEIQNTSNVKMFYYVSFNQGTGILTGITGILTGGIVGFGQAFGDGLSTLTSAIFISDNRLSIFGTLIVVFAGISLAIGLCRLVVRWLGSLGGKKV